MTISIRARAKQRDLDGEIGGFDSREPSLNGRLRRCTIKKHVSGVSRCFFVRLQRSRIADYSLSAGAMGFASALRNLRRNVPDPSMTLFMMKESFRKKYGVFSCLFSSFCIRRGWCWRFFIT